MKKSSKTFILSDETPNLYDFVTVTAGLDLEDFLKNPVMLYNHDYTKLIGQWTDVRKDGDKLLGVPMFDEDDAEAMKYYSKVEQEILKAASIGLTPIQFDEVSKRMEKSRLKETSLTPVPANRAALTLYDNDGKRLSATKALEYCLSLKPVSEQQTKNDNMNKNLIASLVALSAQLGIIVTLSDSSKDEDAIVALNKIAEKVTVLKASETNLSAKVKDLEKAETDKIAKQHADLLKKAVDDKQLSAEQAEGLKSLSIEQLTIVLSAAKPAAIVPIETGKGNEAAVATLDARKDWTYDDYALKAPADLEKMEITDNAKFMKLLSAKAEKARSEHSIQV